MWSYFNMRKTGLGCSEIEMEEFRSETMDRGFWRLWWGQTHTTWKWNQETFAQSSFHSDVGLDNCILVSSVKYQKSTLSSALGSKAPF